jgi:hypothetical protein
MSKGRELCLPSSRWRMASSRASFCSPDPSERTRPLYSLIPRALVAHPPSSFRFRPQWIASEARSFASSPLCFAWSARCFASYRQRKRTRGHRMASSFRRKQTNEVRMPSHGLGKPRNALRKPAEGQRKQRNGRKKPPKARAKPSLSLRRRSLDPEWKTFAFANAGDPSLSPGVVDGSRQPLAGTRRYLRSLRGTTKPRESRRSTLSR